MRILKFEDFVNERWATDTPLEKRIAAGVALIYDNKILLVSPTGSNPDKPNLGIPKGKLDNHDEDPMEAALRELSEETSIQLSPDQLNPDPHQVIFYKHGEPDGKLIYFLCEISDLSEIGLSGDSLELPIEDLQEEEVSWGGFLSADQAYPRMNSGQMIILDRHLIK